MLNRTLFRIIPFLFVCSSFAGTFSRVSDPDGFVNIRVSPSLSGGVIDKATQSQCVETFGTINGWTHIAVFLNNETITGYIRGSRLNEDAGCQIKSVEARLGKCAVAQIIAEEQASLAELKSWFSKFAKCTNPEILASVAENVTRLFAKDWNESLHELSESQADAGFLKFIFAALEASSSGKDLSAIASKSKTCDEKSTTTLCQQIKASANKALGN
jgi:hypothetical protein